jgi:DNA-binding response OmpR family regulator
MKSHRHRFGDPIVHNLRVRRKPVEPRAAPLIVGALSLNCLTFDLRVGDRVVVLTPAEFALLHYMMSNAGQVLSTEQLLCQVWQYPPGSKRSVLIRAHIKNLRIKIERNSREPEYLRTIGHRGYTIGERDACKT